MATQEHPNLPFDDLPKPTPTAAQAKARPQRKSSRVKQCIDAGDWQLYEDNVVKLVCEAVEKYRQLYSDAPEEKAYQVSIWTDPQVQITAVNFETWEHAKQGIRDEAPFFRNMHDELAAAQLEKRGYNSNPAGFKHTVFLQRKHPEIESIDELDYRYHTHRYAADARISASLRRVVKQIKEQQLLANLPREDMVWLGVNSPRDWYDHVIKM